MNISDRIETFNILGKRLSFESIPDIESYLNSTIDLAHNHNAWFTPENIRYAIESIAKFWLQDNILKNWVSNYPETYFNPKSTKTIGVIMAGNIPFVGFHDMLCVLITGNRFLGKFSSKDGDLMKCVSKMICEINPEFNEYINITEDKIHGFDAIIATGSNNSSKYFEYYFKSYPSIIRKHRNSIAVLTGNETNEDLQKLGDDILTYFGLGCRNVSKIFIPIGYNFERFFEAITSWQNLALNNKYANNYEYHKAIFQMNMVEYLDNGFLLLRSEESIGSPVSVLHYQTYQDLEEIKSYLTSHQDEIQCIVTKDKLVENSITFGKSQEPAIDDYADGIDTIKFINNL